MEEQKKQKNFFLNICNKYIDLRYVIKPPKKSFKKCQQKLKDNISLSVIVPT